MQTLERKNPIVLSKKRAWFFFSLAVAVWLSFIISYVVVDPMNASLPGGKHKFQDASPVQWMVSPRHLRSGFPQKWEVATIHRYETNRTGDGDARNGRPRQIPPKEANYEPILWTESKGEDEDKKEVHSEFNLLYEKTNKTMSACLLVMDDTIKLTEWLAYHYTVLPLSHLIVAIDPHSLLEDKIRSVLDLWKDRLEHLEIWAQDTWMRLNATVGWRRSIYKGNTTEYEGWFINQNSVKGRFHVHNRRQQHFAVQCMRKMKQLNQSWVLHTDTDEFVQYNYLGDDEDHSNFDSHRKRDNPKLQEDYERRTRKLREKVLPIREKLPTIGQVTIADFLEHLKIPDSCVHMPGLQISAKESRLSQVSKDVPPNIDARKLMSLRHRKYGRKSGRFTKAMIDVSKVSWDLLVDEQVVTIHTPVRSVCPYNGASGSGYDYIAAIFRLSHFAGTLRSFHERQNDGRRTRQSEFHKRDVDPVGESDDIRPWIKVFVNKVGIQSANELLSPLDKAYQKRDLDTVF
jgi:hypothetical protein